MAGEAGAADSPTAAKAHTAAQATLDAHVRDVVQWHFSPETGTPFWLDWAAQAGCNPAREIQGFAELVKLLPRFEGRWLRDLPHERWIPRAYAGRPYAVFETGGTTGRPKQRLNWEDYQTDYTAYSATLDDAAFPRGAAWLMVGPTGPRRLRLAVEHLANERGGPCFFVDLDPRWVRKCLAAGNTAGAEAYMTHVVEQARTLLCSRPIRVLFTTPRLLEAIGEQVSLPGLGIQGVMCGGTQMTPQTLRFLVEEVLEERARLVPVYGNTLMGLAASRPLSAADGYSVTYHAPQPRAVLRVVEPEEPSRLVPVGSRGRVELTTLTRELLLPGFLERDEAIRRAPCAVWPWDGVGEVRPLGAEQSAVIEGVY